jgi:hypothetical protein
MSRVDEMRELVNRLAGDHASREQALDALRQNVRMMMGDFTSERAAMGVELRTSLEQFKAALEADVSGTLAGYAAERQAMAKTLAAQLEQFKAALEADVSGTLAGYAAERQAMAKTLAAQLEQFKAALEADVSGTLAGYAAEHAEVVQLWREFAAAMAGGFPKPAEPAPMVAPPPPAQPTEEVDAAELVLAYLAGHPEGAKLVDLASTFGLARPQMGKLLRHLVDSGQVVKDPETLVYKLAEGNPL